MIVYLFALYVLNCNIMRTLSATADLDREARAVIAQQFPVYTYRSCSPATSARRYTFLTLVASRSVM